MRNVVPPSCLYALPFFALALSLVCSPVDAQQRPVPANTTPVPPGTAGDKKPKPQMIEAMTFPSDRNARQMIQAVKDYLEEHKDKPNAPWDKICFAAQQVLEEKSDSFFEITRPDDDSGRIQRISAKAEVNRLIGGLPSAGRQFYQLTYGPPAEALLNEAKTNGYDRMLLAECSQRYFHTKAGAQATLLLAGLHLDRGNFVEAAYCFERLLARPESDDLWTASNLFKAIVALRRSGSHANETVAKLMAQLEKKMPRDGLQLGRQRFSFEDLNSELQRPFETLFGRVGEAYVAMRMGNNSHTSIADGGRPFLDPTFQVSTITNQDQNSQPGEGPIKVQQNLEQILRGFKPGKGDIALPGFFPVTTQNLIIYRGYDGVNAVTARNGTFAGKPVTAGYLQWSAKTKGCLNKLLGDSDSNTVENWWAYYRDMANSRTLLFENPLVGSMSHDSQNVYIIDDAAIPQPPPLNRNDIGIMQQARQPEQTVNSSLFENGSQLTAINLETGRLIWQLGQDFSEPNAPPLTLEEEDKLSNPLQLMEKSFFLGPPLPLNGKLYVLFEKAGRIRLACLDPTRMHKYKGAKLIDAVPELVWSQRLGEPNLRLPSDANRRYQCSYLAYADGVLICPTNAGAVVAVDVMSRSLLWARSYRSVKVSNPIDDPIAGRGFGRGGIRGTAQPLSPLPADRWRASAPIVSSGRVVFTAFDSESLDCLDLVTGDLIWSEPKRPSDLYVGGLLSDKIVIVGKDTVRAVNLFGKKRPMDPATGKASGQEETVAPWTEVRTGTPAGHGAASKGGIYYLPLAQTSDSSNPEVWAIDVEKGNVLAKTTFRNRQGTTLKATLGNLVFHEGQLFSQSISELTGFPLIELKKQEMDKRLLANPRDPLGLLARGELNFDDGNLKESLIDLKEAQKQGPPPEAMPRLREKLYQVYTELLRNDFVAAEPYLKEYRDLCEVNSDTEDPNQLQKIKDEQVRRKGLYLVLVAKGREKQGQLDQAFESYREFAKLGNNQQLVSIFDDPMIQTRPDIWARGRIDAMIRNASGKASSKLLEDRIAREWSQVQNSTDLNKLREFVQVFGYDTPSGRKGLLLLAERLIANASEENLREAQSLLVRMQGITEDREDMARALEIQARLLIHRGLLEDAVYSYTHLSQHYADVVLPPGKTGAEVYDDVLTDKRLIAYLEPPRSASSSRIKVTTNNQATPVNSAGTIFEPDGEEGSPLFRRYRLSLVNDQNSNGMMSYRLRVNDRFTGQLIKEYPGIKALTAGINLNTLRLAQAHGHLLLMHIGNTVYCIDLIEKRQLWEYNVLGDLPSIDPNRWQMEIPAEGELIVTYNVDGSKIRLGRSSLLTSSAVCLVTREGLVAVDPRTGLPIWKRTNVSPASLIFGDARYLIVVEPMSSNKSRSTVYRTMDGAVIDNVPDCGNLVSGPGRIRILGRNVLLTEGGTRTEKRILRLYDPLTGKDLWKKEFPEGTQLLKTSNNDFTGVITPTGEVEIFNVDTGKRQINGKIEEKLFASLQLPTQLAQFHPVLYIDNERYFVALNKNAGANRGWNPYGTNIRTETITGPIVCFSRSSGKALWFTETLFENQQLLIDRFSDQQALISVTSTFENNANYQTSRVIVVDRTNGKIRHLKNYSQQTTIFSGIETNSRTGVTTLHTSNMTLEIRPDDSVQTVGAR